MSDPVDRTTKPRNFGLGQALLLAVLFAMLLFAIVWSMMAWTSAEDAQMSTHGWIALALGTISSLVIGCGLMALMFYSSRSGYDETATPKFKKEDVPPE
ncbi:protein-S-isoprenylcysteine O-methyltransferase Ste14 [Nitrobacteraceae bacterium AZCC 2146]